VQRQGISLCFVRTSTDKISTNFTEYTGFSIEFADVLEQLESTFYAQALQKFKESDFQAAGFSSAQIPIQQFTQIGGDEATHSTVLQVCTRIRLASFL
jgi:hypothetical protein